MINAFRVNQPPVYVWDWRTSLLQQEIWTILSRLLGLAIVLFILSRHILPWSLRHLSKRVRARSISLRSIRGLYLRVGRFTIRVERISLSYRRRNEEDVTRRLSFRFQMIEIRVYPPISRSANSNETKQLPIISGRLRALYTAIHSFTSQMSIFDALYFSLSWWLRPLLRLYFVTTGRLLIRILPSLAQLIHLEVDQLTLQSMSFAGVGVHANHLQVSLSLHFTRLEQVVAANYPKSSRTTARLSGTTSWSPSIGTRFWASASRTWEKAWGEAEGEVSMAIEIGDIHSLNPSEECGFARWREKSGLNSSMSNSVVSIGTIRISSSCGFNPRLVHLHENSLRLMLDLCDINVDVSSKSTSENVANEMFGRNTRESEEQRPNKVNEDTANLKAYPWLHPSVSGNSKKKSLLKVLDSVLIDTQRCVATIPVSRVTVRRASGDVNSVKLEWLGALPALEEATVTQSWISIFELPSLECHILKEHRTPCQATVAASVKSLNAICLFRPPTFVSPPFELFEIDTSSSLYFLADISLGNVSLSVDQEELFGIAQVIMVGSKQVPSDRDVKIPLKYSSRGHCFIRVSKVLCSLRNDGGIDGSLGVLVWETDRILLECNWTHKGHSAHQEVRLTNSKEDSLLSKGYIHTSLDNCHMHAFVLQDCSQQFIWQNAPEESAFYETDPVLSVASIEGKVDWSSHAINMSADASSVSNIFTAIEFSIMADDFIVEVWKDDHITSLAIFASTLGMLRSQQSPSAPPKQARASCRYLSGTVSIIPITILVTGNDINPACDLRLSRGICLQSRLSFSHHTASAQIPQWIFADMYHRAQLRRNLGLNDTVSFKFVTAYGALINGRTARWSYLLLKDTTLRRAISTPYASSIPPYQEVEAGLDDLDTNTLVLSVPSCEVNLRSKLDDASIFPEERCQLIDVGNVSLHFQLLSAYACLRSSYTLQSILSHWKSQSPGISTSAMSFGLTCRVKDIHILVQFPLSQKAFINTSDIILNKESHGGFNIKIGSLTSYVSSLISQDWVQIVSMKACQCTFLGQDFPVRVESTGLLVRIPWKYVVADLVLDIATTVKALRHLAKLNKKSKFESMDDPHSEEPKKIPNLIFEIQAFRFEIEDDPFEANLGLIWRTSQRAQQVRNERDIAFSSKVATILESSSRLERTSNTGDYSFDSTHTVSIDEAHRRLLAVHSAAWRQSIKDAQKERHQSELGHSQTTKERNIFKINTQDNLSERVALFHVTILRLNLHIENLCLDSDVILALMGKLADPLPPLTRFTLWIPIQIRVHAHAINASLRDYPIPLLHILPQNPDANGLDLKSDLILAEELGPPTATFWVDCCVSAADRDALGARPFVMKVPKTVMPIKLYAKPTLKIAACITTLSWAVSYLPTIQGASKVIESFTHSPCDSSPPLGFWDKIRLVLHGSMSILFETEVILYLKGTRDPYDLSTEGAGFAFRWRGRPSISIGHPNKARELIQVTSNSLTIVIPRITHFKCGSPQREMIIPPLIHEDKKIVAKFENVIQMGLGFVLERTCSGKCDKCSSHATCRVFKFEPHHLIRIRANSEIGPDSFSGFRSDFIHMSFSLVSPAASAPKSSGVHLSGLTFAHFWRWWNTFEGSMFLPIRQGDLYPNSRSNVPKFGKHLATVKYRISVENLFISHVYNHDTSDSWHEGQTRMVGIKVHMSRFSADLHQRDQRKQVIPCSQNVKKASRKVFNAVEVNVDCINLKTMYAVFEERSKLSIRMPHEPSKHSNPPWQNAPLLTSMSEWFALDDWNELDYQANATPKVYMLDFARCPHFSYRKSSPENSEIFEDTRFGSEDTHVCLMGHESSSRSIRLALNRQRLQALTAAAIETSKGSVRSDLQPQILKHRQFIECAIRQLEGSSEVELLSARHESVGEDFPLPSSREGKDFAHVYHFHSPTVSLSKASRNIMMQYYYASRRRRGFEYHMTARAVQYIRKQAETLYTEPVETNEGKKSRYTSASAQAAAQVFKRIITRDERAKTKTESECSDEGITTSTISSFDPSAGWLSPEISINSGHCCLLNNPSIVLHSDGTLGSAIVLAARRASLQSYAVMDKSNVDDPINGRIMTRTFSKLLGLQAFAPTSTNISENFIYACLPPEDLMSDPYNSDSFDRLIPATDANLQYDKFNRLRLRNEVSSVQPPGLLNRGDAEVEHLKHHSDLIVIDAPRISVSANSRHFSTISHVLTDLLLYSDPMYQRRAEELETYMILYDFHDLEEAARVISGYQDRIRALQCTLRDFEETLNNEDAFASETTLHLSAQILSILEELDIIFEAVKVAQDKTNDTNQDLKMALRLLAKSSEISWQMIGNTSTLLAKLSLKDVHFSWLSRQDSSTVNALRIRDFHAYDGSSMAIWPELLAKYSEPANHPLVKKATFAEASWCVLPPVGGIAIYEQFKLTLHPIRLQIHTLLGTRILEYIWPSRGGNAILSTSSTQTVDQSTPAIERTKMDMTTGSAFDVKGTSLLASRSFQNLKDILLDKPALKRAQSYESLAAIRLDDDRIYPFESNKMKTSTQVGANVIHQEALEMRQRSAQKTFIHVEISSIYLLLSIMKEDAFLCRNAKIHTRELLFRNQTFSFEELVRQFVPSDPSWRGWVKVALHQPLLPVLPVAREIISKTKWGSKQVAKLLPSSNTDGGKLKRRPKSKDGPSSKNMIV